METTPWFLAPKNDFVLVSIDLVKIALAQIPNSYISHDAPTEPSSKNPIHFARSTHIASSIP